MQTSDTCVADVLYDRGEHIQGIMRKIQLKDAKANLSAVLDRAAQGKPSVITRHGKPAAVVLGFADWERLSRVPSFGRLLMSAPLGAGDLPERVGPQTGSNPRDAR